MKNLILPTTWHTISHKFCNIWWAGGGKGGRTDDLPGAGEDTRGGGHAQGEAGQARRRKRLIAVR